MQEAAVTALRLARHVAQPGVRTRLAALDGRGFDLAGLDELAPMAWAAWRARAGFVGAMAESNTLRLPAALFAKATSLKESVDACEEGKRPDDRSRRAERVT